MKSQIKTVWSENTPEVPLAEYPRPQLVRNNWTCLNGLWEFAVTDIAEDNPQQYEGTIMVPFAIESERSGVLRTFRPDQRLHYRRKISIEKNPGKRLLLNFEAVDWQCKVYINGSEAGHHTGGYIPFSFDITDFVSDGENELCVSVTDPTDTHWQQRGKQKLDPVTIWYTPTSGIWQTVWLEEVSENYIKSIKMTPTTDYGVLDIFIETDEKAKCSLNIYKGKEQVLSTELKSNEHTSLKIKDPVLWTPENPFLYDARIATSSDEITSYFGLRTFSLNNNPRDCCTFTLNGRPYFMNGPLDQGYWPESGMTQPSDEAIVFDLQSMKDLGFNTIRKHIKVESRRWYYHADRLGLLVIQDMPSGGREMTGYLRDEMGIAYDETQRDNVDIAYIAALRDTAESRNMFESELTEMVSHLHNHPSIAIWCPFNEAWGQYDSVRIYDLTKKLDPSRPVDHASGWYDQGCGDFRSVHTYKKKLKSPPADDKRAYLISEYGGYNFIDTEHLWRNDDSFGYQYYKTCDELNSAYKELIEEQVVPLIKDGLCGVIYTQLSDVEIETNGFFTYDRKVLKFDSEMMNELHKKVQMAFNATNGIY